MGARKSKKCEVFLTRDLEFGYLRLGPEIFWPRWGKGAVCLNL